VKLHQLSWHAFLKIWHFIGVSYIKSIELCFRYLGEKKTSNKNLVMELGCRN